MSRTIQESLFRTSIVTSVVNTLCLQLPGNTEKNPDFAQQRYFGNDNVTVHALAARKCFYFIQQNKDFCQGTFCLARNCNSSLHDFIFFSFYFLNKCKLATQSIQYKKHNRILIKLEVSPKNVADPGMSVIIITAQNPKARGGQTWHQTSLS